MNYNEYVKNHPIVFFKEYYQNGLASPTQWDINYVNNPTPNIVLTPSVSGVMVEYQQVTLIGDESQSHISTTVISSDEYWTQYTIKDYDYWENYDVTQLT